MGSGKVDFEERFSEVVGKPIKTAIPLKEHASFKIGGKADYFFTAFSLTELVQAVNLAREFPVPYYVIGGGYNLLFDDQGFRGLIIKNCAMGIGLRGKAKIETLSGTLLSELLTFCVDKGLKGLEFLAGIPGSVGGAVFGNAGAFDQAIGDFLTEALLLNEKEKQVEVDRDFFAFGYRYSRLRTSRELLLKATFELEEGDIKEIKSRIDENLAKRAKKQPPWDVACAGSYFKNPVLPDGKRVPAAYLLDQVGAKNVVVGGAAVFKNHANFIINQRGTTSQNVLNLAQELKRRVKEKFGVELEEEVIFLSSKLSKT
jgi:UDP-N-acetylmuramate dehydrogenase